LGPSDHHILGKTTFATLNWLLLWWSKFHIFPAAAQASFDPLTGSCPLMGRKHRRKGRKSWTLGQCWPSEASLDKALFTQALLTGNLAWAIKKKHHKTTISKNWQII